MSKSHMYIVIINRSVGYCHIMIMDDVSSKLSLPKDVLLRASMIHMIGQYEIYIENYKSIIEYTDTLIKIQAKTCKLIINGQHLHIEYFTNDDMKISGRIKSIEYI